MHERHIEQVDRVIQQKIGASAGEPLDRLVSHLIDGMIEVHASDPELATMLDSEVPHRADKAGEFSLRVHGALRKALAPHAEILGGAAKLDLRAFLLANMLDAFGHAIVLRRPRALSQRNARTGTCKAILATLKILAACLDDGVTTALRKGPPNCPVHQLLPTGQSTYFRP